MIEGCPFAVFKYPQGFLSKTGRPIPLLPPNSLNGAIHPQVCYLLRDGGMAVRGLRAVGGDLDQCRAVFTTRSETLYLGIVAEVIPTHLCFLALLPSFPYALFFISGLSLVDKCRSSPDVPPGDRFPRQEKCVSHRNPSRRPQ
jgi:hypothetical protein